MSLNLNITKLDTTKETEGVWFDYEEGIRFKIAKWENPNWALKMLVLMKPYQQRQQRGKQIEETVYLDIMNKVMAETIILDWEGLKDGDEDFKYSTKNALTMLEDETLKHLKEWILERSQDIRNYYVDRIEEGVEQAKKS